MEKSTESLYRNFFNSTERMNNNPDKIAILILAHRNVEQLSSLITTLDDDRFDIFVHIDKKSSMAFKTPRVNNARVFFKEVTRIATYLNDFSLVDATCSLINSTLNINRGGGYRYYVLLTGQDYPIKSNDEIYRKLIDSYPTCWIDSYGVDEAATKGVKWVEHVGHFRFSQRFRRLLLRMVGSRFYFSSKGKTVKAFAVIYDRVMTKLTVPPRRKVKMLGYTYSVGSHFWMLPDVAIRHIMSVYNSDDEINRIFRHTPAPEESYFQTVLSTMPDAIIPDPYHQFDSQWAEMDNPALRLIKWYENGVHTSGHPAIWNEADYDFISHAKALFGRKFEYGTAVVEMINHNLR